jgi:hypothetical protein
MTPSGHCRSCPIWGPLTIRAGLSLVPGMPRPKARVLGLLSPPKKRAYARKGDPKVTLSPQIPGLAFWHFPALSCTHEMPSWGESL